MKERPNWVLMTFISCIALTTGCTTIHRHRSWSQTLPAADRFVLVMPTSANPGGEAVLDKETGLVWERSPAGTTLSWGAAWTHCYNRTVGDRKGWRIPTMEELASLVDPTQSSPALPSGHPFSNVQSTFYWTVTTVAGDPNGAWLVSFINGGVVGQNKLTPNSRVWCVRGGQGFDGQ